MSNQPSGSAPEAAPIPHGTPTTPATNPPPDLLPKYVKASAQRPNMPPRMLQPLSQEREKAFRILWPAWARQLPRPSFPSPNADFELLSKTSVQELLNSADPVVAARIREDITFLEHDVLRLFRARDYEAAYQQNRYRLYQIGYIVLATAATLVGSIQALMLSGQQRWIPLFAFLETLIALFATYLSTLSGREPPYNLWMINRRRAESLRREYFRFLMNMPPYNQYQDYHRRTVLAQRAADINRGVFPEESPNTPQH